MKTSHGLVFSVIVWTSIVISSTILALVHRERFVATRALLVSNRTRIATHDPKKVFVLTFHTDEARLRRKLSHVQSRYAEMKSNKQPSPFDSVEVRGIYSGPRTRAIMTGQWYRNIFKISALLEELQTNYSSQSNPLIIFHDYDVFFGKCNVNFAEKFEELTAGTGKKILFSAENAVSKEWQTRWKPMFPPIPEETLNEYPNLSKENIGPFSLPQHICGENRCDNPFQYRFLNSGFLMGRRNDLVSMLEDLMKMVRYGDLTNRIFRAYRSEYRSDQEWYSMYFLSHKDLIALDYGAELALSLTKFRRDILDVNMETGEVRSRLHKNRTICFLHPNGSAKSEFQDLTRFWKI